MPQKINISWYQFVQDVEILAKKIPKGKYDKILVVAKGGMIPAYYLAKELGINIIETICISSYTNENQDVFKVHLDRKSKEKGWLIVDDLVDSGLTMQQTKIRFPKAHTAVLYVKPSSQNVPDYFVKKFPDKWIVFPWEG